MKNDTFWNLKISEGETEIPVALDELDLRMKWIYFGWTIHIKNVKQLRNIQKAKKFSRI